MPEEEHREVLIHFTWGVRVREGRSSCSFSDLHEQLTFQCSRGTHRAEIFRRRDESDREVHCQAREMIPRKKNHRDGSMVILCLII